MTILTFSARGASEIIFSSQDATSVSLAWTPNSEPNLGGYRLYYGTASGNYTDNLDVGNVTTATISNLTASTQYFIVLTAYNLAGIESQPSTEISYTTPSIEPSPSPTPTPDPSVTPTPEPTVTPTPDPSVTPTPEPTVTPTPDPSATPTPEPTVTPTPQPSPTPTPEPSVTPTPQPSPTPTPQPTASPSPSTTPTPLPSATPSSTPSPAPTATPTPLAGLTFGATQGVITSPFARNTDNTVSQTVETLNPLNGGKAVYAFTVTNPGPHIVTINVKAPDAGANSLFANMDAEPTTTMIWDVPVGSGFQSKPITWRATGGVNPQKWSLSAGTHLLILRGREANLKVGQITISRSASSSPTPTPHPVGHNLLNVATRTFVQNGEEVMIGGFIIIGNQPKKVIVRGIGPSLAQAGIAGAMADPLLELYDSRGTLIGSNDNWITHRDEVMETGIPPSDSRESAIVTTLAPGNYTCVLRSKTNNPGVALFELYDLDATSSRLVNISTRGKVGLGENVVIGGFIIGGDQPTKVLIRATGPSLANSHISNALQDPKLELHGPTGSLIFANDNWRTSQQQQIEATGIPPSDNRESAILANLQPGHYTAIVRGAGNTTGVALVEVYNLDN